jgi:hypothetical protein
MLISVDKPLATSEKTNVIPTCKKRVRCVAEAAATSMSVHFGTTPSAVRVVRLLPVRGHALNYGIHSM